MTKRQLRNCVLLLACGGMTLQSGGCASQLAAALTSQLLNTVVPALFTAALSGLTGTQNQTTG